VLSTFFHYPKPEAKYARLAVGFLGAHLVYAGIHILLKSNTDILWTFHESILPNRVYPVDSDVGTPC
jgi:hypothetical protein